MSNLAPVHAARAACTGALGVARCGRAGRRRRRRGAGDEAAATRRSCPCPGRVACRVRPAQDRRRGPGSPRSCMAQFIERLPPRLSRTLPLLAPAHTGTGAVPVKRANAPLSRNRWTPAVSPMTTAAESTPSAGDGQQARGEIPNELHDIDAKKADADRRSRSRVATPDSPAQARPPAARR